MRGLLVGALASAIVLSLGGCSSNGEADTADADTSSDEANAAGGGDSNAETTKDTVPQVAGAPLNRFDLQVGQCFNEGSWYDEELDRRVDLTASINCVEDHLFEVYHEAEFPAPNGAPFPGETSMTEWSTQLCYEAFETFVGTEYETSTLEIGFVQPTRDTFEHPVGRHRRVFCYVYYASGEPKQGSAEATGL